jgi:hypothetical protein
MYAPGSSTKSHHCFWRQKIKLKHVDFRLHLDGRPLIFWDFSHLRGENRTKKSLDIVVHL